MLIQFISMPIRRITDYQLFFYNFCCLAERRFSFKSHNKLGAVGGKWAHRDHSVQNRMLKKLFAKSQGKLLLDAMARTTPLRTFIKPAEGIVISLNNHEMVDSLGSYAPRRAFRHGFFQSNSPFGHHRKDMCFVVFQGESGARREMDNQLTTEIYVPQN